MSLKIVVRGFKGTQTAEAELIVPLTTIGATGRTYHNIPMITDFTTPFIKTTFDEPNLAKVLKLDCDSGDVASTTEIFGENVHVGMKSTSNVLVRTTQGAMSSGAQTSLITIRIMTASGSTTEHKV